MTKNCSPSSEPAMKRDSVRKPSKSTWRAKKCSSNLSLDVVEMNAGYTSTPPTSGMQFAVPGQSAISLPAAGVQYIGPGQPMMAGAPVILQAPASVRHALDLQLLTSMKALSIMQIICGSLSILFETSHIITTRQGSSGSGIWCGFFFIVAGILGVVGAAQNRKALFIATLVLSVLSTIALLVIIAFMGALIEYCVDTRWKNVYLRCSNQDYAFGSLLMINCTVEFVVSIWASVLCCKGLCAVGSQESMHYTPQPVYYSMQAPTGSHIMVQPTTSGALQQQPPLIPAEQYNVNQTSYPQQQYAIANTSYAVGVAGLTRSDASQQ